MKITSHRELEVWREAVELAMEVFTLSKAFPGDERPSLTDPQDSYVGSQHYYRGTHRLTAQNKLSPHSA